MRARFYGCIQVVENVGYLIAAPILQSAWAKGLELQHQWLGLPFMVAAVCHLLWTGSTPHRLILTGPVRDRISDIFVCFARPPSSTSDPDI